jgi:hypothetical protein
VQQGTSQPENSFKLETFTVCAGLGALLILAGLLLAFDELNDGGDYAFWFALTVFARLAAIGVLVLLCALRVGDASWGASLRRATPAIGVGVVVASIALAFYDVSEGFGEAFWTPLNDLFYYIPVTLGAAVVLSATPRGDRVLGSPSQWGRILGAIALVVGLAIAFDDVSDAGGDEIWVFLSSFGVTTGLALFLLALSLEAAGDMTQPQGGQIRVAELLKDARLPNWIAIGAVGVVIAGVLLGIKSMDAPSDGLWLMLQQWGFFLGLGSMVLIASGGQVGGYLRGDHPYLRYALIGGLVVMFIAGVKFAADANSDQFWWFLSDAIEYPAFLMLAYVMFEAKQRPLRVVR